MKHASHARAGFTLLEISIVIVIIGLLVGGVLAGRDLMRAASLNAVISEFRKYTGAMGQFRDKYSALPGDMSTASSYWVSAGNGNGDGMIKNTAVIGTNEISLFWVHLSNAGFVEGSFTAIADVTLTPGTNNPRSKLNGGAWNVAYLGTVGVDGQCTPVAGTVTPAASSTTFYDGTYENALLFGSGSTAIATTGIVPTGLLTSSEASSIDTKLDDGKPASGDVLTLEAQGNATAGSGCGNLASSNATTRSASTYDLTNTSGTACSLVFKSGY